ncbi:uncharacterized protein LOC131077844 [Cryptomeria japonica]|uniref:uncharacterized protein LOC131077844 n=1 Tax=Cryptomeria japonica TaxID=3369 RepID=UPI0025ABF668|nr:uncharacterized protein LOC131077844 [Cryptomeria japonica]
MSVKNGYIVPNAPPIDPDAKKEYVNNAKAKHAILSGLSDTEFVKVMHCSSSKEALDKLKILFEGDVKVKEAKLQTLRAHLEGLKMKDEEKIVDYLQRVDEMVILLEDLERIYLMNLLSKRTALDISNIEPLNINTEKGFCNIYPKLYTGALDYTDIWLKKGSDMNVLSNMNPSNRPESENNIIQLEEKIPASQNQQHSTRLNDKENVVKEIENLKELIKDTELLKAEAELALGNIVTTQDEEVTSDLRSPKVDLIQNPSYEEEMGTEPLLNAAMEVFDNNIVQDLTPEEEEERCFLLKELMSSMEDEDIREVRREIGYLEINNHRVDPLSSPIPVRTGSGIETQDVLGIKNFYSGKTQPDCAKLVKSRGRKSLGELRSQVGNAKDQGKLTAFFENGKGKSLPVTQ